MSIILSILIIAFQDFVLYYFISLTLSLWNVNPIIPLILTFLIVPIQLFTAGNLIKLFFLHTQEEKTRCSHLKEIVYNILKNYSIKNYEILIFSDEIPIILSFGALLQKKYIAISTGFFKTLNEKETNILIKREANILSNLDTNLFTSAIFIPFTLIIASSWFLETTRFSRFQRNSNAPYLVGQIFEKIALILQIPLFFIAHKRHKNADTTIKNKRQLFSSIEKITDDFIKPTKSGLPFRKKIFEALSVFLPFDPKRAQKVEVWKIFLNLKKETINIHEGGKILEKHNYFFYLDSFLSPHPSFKNRFNNDLENRCPSHIIKSIKSLCHNTKKYFYINNLPIIGFIIGILLSISLRKWFGILFILPSIGIITRLTYNLNLIRETDKTFSSNYTKAEISGFLHGYTIPERIDSSYFFIISQTQICVVNIHQIYKNNIALINLLEKEVSLKGVIKVEDIPYIDITRICSNKEENIIIKSPYNLIQILIAIFLSFAGLLLILLQYFQYIK